MDSNRTRNDLNHYRQNCGCSGSGQNASGRRQPTHAAVRSVSQQDCSCTTGSHQNPVGIPAPQDCGCGMNAGSLFDQSVIAMAYVPWQKFEDIWKPGESLHRGTIFPSLYKPFMRGGCGNHERTK